jgi:nucleotide-binding universal stress UspA family protein
MEKILVPTDFSSDANNAVKYAVHFAQETGRSIVFFHVTHKDIPTALAHDVYLKKVKEDIDRASTALHAHIEKIYESSQLVYHPNKVTFDVKFGHNAQDEIVDAAESHKVALIIMGTHGATGLKKIFFGSNTVGVLKKGNCPVLAIPANAKYTTIEHIGYSSNLEDLDTEVAKILPIVKKFNASLGIFNVYPVYPSNINYATFDAEKRVETLKEKHKYKKLSLTLINRPKENDLEGGMEEFIHKYKPDLIIMFSKTRDWFERLTNPSATEDIALNPKVPLLSIKA